MSFEEFGLLPELCAAVQQMGWRLPSDVQAECIPLILGGGDVMCASETGTGKTGAFALPLVQIVHETLRDPLKASVCGCGALLSPSPPQVARRPCLCRCSDLLHGRAAR
jgi:ATP-dependent RNA helicase DDX1